MSTLVSGSVPGSEGVQCNMSEPGGRSQGVGEGRHTSGVGWSWEVRKSRGSTGRRRDRTRIDPRNT